MSPDATTLLLSDASRTALLLEGGPTYALDTIPNGLLDAWSYEEVLPTFRRMENTPTGEDLYESTWPLVRTRRTRQIPWGSASVCFGMIDI
jgi:hypothetical protein